MSPTTPDATRQEKHNMPTTTTTTLRSIAQLREIGQRSALLAGLVTTLEAGQARIAELLNMAELDAAQAAEFDDLTASTGERSTAALWERADEIAEQVERAGRAAAATAEMGGAGPTGAGGAVERAHEPRARVTNEPTVYRQGAQNSYFRDLTRVMLNLPGADRNGALERMERNSREVAVGMQERALTTVDGAGGDFVPPLWMVDQFIELARAGRVTADRVNRQNLPGGTDSINVPRLATGTAVAEQATQNTAVQNTDATTNSIAGAVTTIAGQQVVAVQLIEQSPINMDELLLADLAADYAVKADLFVITNNAAGKLGILSVSGTNAITFTSGAPTVALLYPKVADAVQQILTGRFLPPDTIVMHPRRWAWFLAATDTAGRPLVTPYDGFNQVASFDGVTPQGFVGTLQGVPVFVDPNVPINLGAGTNEDRIIVGRFSDAILWEGTERAEAFRETKADQLSVLLRFYNYLAFIGGRYPKSFSIIAGTGLVTPTF
jgi:HK97 family phage major capsid protein